MPNLEKLLEQIKEKVYHLSDVQKLKSLRGHLEEREKHAHPDFLDTHHKEGDHQSRIEHHAANFWHYYYPGERPKTVIEDEPFHEHIYNTEEEHHQARARMIETGTGAPAESQLSMTPMQKQQNWMYDIMVGELALDKKNFAEAERQFKSVLSKADQYRIPDSLLVKALRKLARSLSAQGKYSEFERVYEQSLVLDSELPESEGYFPEEEELNHIACEYLRQGRDEEAKEMYRHVLAVLERLRGPESAVVARCLNDLAGVYAKTEEWQKAEDLLQRAIQINEKASQQQSAEMATSLHNLGALYQHHNRTGEAQELFGRAMAILEKHASDRSPL